MAGITRKKSAKELAAAAALAAQGQGSNQAEGSGHDDVAGKTKGNQQTQGQVPSSTEAQPGPTNQIGKDAVDSQSLNKAMTLMKDTHISLERELSELKASNEMLWRQAMLSREEQLKSQKKLDSVMRFLAGQFGSMNMSLLEDEGDNLPSTSGTQPTRIARFGKGRMIGDGINGVEGNASDEDMDEETDLWETGDHEESRQFWEVDDSGKMIKVPQPRGKRGYFASDDLEQTLDLNLTHPRSRKTEFYRATLAGENGHAYPPQFQSRSGTRLTTQDGFVAIKAF